MLGPVPFPVNSNLKFGKTAPIPNSFASKKVLNLVSILEELKSEI